MRTQFTLFFALAFHLFCQAAQLGLSWSNFNYLYRDRIDSSQSLFNAFERFDIYSSGIGGADLSFFASADASSGPGQTGLQRFEFLQGYFQWEDIAGSPFSLKAGRQSQFDAPVPVFYDGLRFDTAPLSFLSFDISGGRAVKSPNSISPSVHEGESLQMPIIAGVNVSPATTTSIRLSYLHTAGNDSIVSKQLGALDAIQMFESSSWAAVHVLLNKLSVQNLSLTGLITPLEFLSLYPSFVTEYRLHDSTIVFERLINERHYDPSLYIQFDMQKFLLIGTGYTGRFFGGNRTIHIMNSTFELMRARVSYRFEWGDEGDGHHVDGGIDVIRKTRFMTGIYGGYSIWADSAEAPLESRAWTGTVSLDAKPWPFFDIRFEFQALSNRLYVVDLRAFLGTRIHLTRFVR